MGLRVRPVEFHFTTAWSRTARKRMVPFIYPLQMLHTVAYDLVVSGSRGLFLRAKLSWFSDMWRRIAMLTFTCLSPSPSFLACWAGCGQGINHFIRSLVPSSSVYQVSAGLNGLEGSKLYLPHLSVQLALVSKIDILQDPFTIAGINRSCHCSLFDTRRISLSWCLGHEKEHWFSC